MKKTAFKLPAINKAQSKGSQKGAKARRLQAQNQREQKRENTLSYTTLDTPKHAKILQSALTQCKQRLGMA